MSSADDSTDAMRAHDMPPNLLPSDQPPPAQSDAPDAAAGLPQEQEQEQEQEEAPSGQPDSPPSDASSATAAAPTASPDSSAAMPTTDSAKRPGEDNGGEDNNNNDNTDTTTTTGTPPPAKRRALCGVCNTEPSKYKCPRCLLQYCSLACSRIHKDNHPPDEPDKKKEEPPAAAAAAAAAPTESAAPVAAAPLHPFHVLDDAPELRRLFATYPRLHARLQTIFDATLPPKNPPSNGRGGRGGFRGRGGGRGGASTQVWTREIGLLQGQKALRRARVDPSEDGDAVRAYCEVVTYLLNRGSSSGGEAATATTATAATAATATTVAPTTAAPTPATAIVQAELEAERTQVIKQLLDTEGRQ